MSARNPWTEAHFKVYCGSCTPFVYKSKRVNTWSFCRVAQKLLDNEECPRERYENQFKIEVVDGQERSGQETKADGGKHREG